MRASRGVRTQSGRLANFETHAENLLPALAKPHKFVYTNLIAVWSAPKGIHMRHATAVLAVIACSFMAACSGTSYVSARSSETGWRPESLPIPTPSIAGKAEPKAKFPPVIAISPMPGAPARNNNRYADNADSNVRAEESRARLDSLEKLPGVERIVVLNSLTLNPSSQSSVYDAAGAVNADMIVLYRVGSGTVREDTTIPGLGVLTLGLFPNETRKCYATASAIVLDARTGYLYGALEASSSAWRLANGWTNHREDETVAFEARSKALTELVKRFPPLWEHIKVQYGPGAMHTSESSKTDRG